MNGTCRSSCRVWLDTYQETHIGWGRRKFGRPRLKEFADVENDLQELKMEANAREDGEICRKVN
jgi:hypothetical protein